MYGQGIRPLDAMTLPDMPSAGFYRPDERESVPLTLEIYHRLVGSLALDLPADLVVHPTFDVARNLLLYAWFWVLDPPLRFRFRAADSTVA